MCWWIRWRTCIPETLPDKAGDNVIVRLCSFECEFDTTLDDPQREPNAGFAADLEGWSQLTNRLYVWDYTTDFDIYLQTFPNFHVLQPNIQYLLRHHVTGIFEQGNREPDGEFGALRAYLLAKLLWNPEEDVQALTDGFLEHYYGKGWRASQSLYHRLRGADPGTGHRRHHLRQDRKAGSF